MSGEKLQHLPRCKLGVCPIGIRARTLQPQPGSVYRWVLATAVFERERGLSLQIVLTWSLVTGDGFDGGIYCCLLARSA